MTLRTSILTGFAAILSAGLLITTPAHAADSQHRQELGRQSRTAGLATSEATLLRRVQGDGAAQVADRLIQRFASASGGVSTAGDARIHELPDQVRVESAAGWSLTVYGDGTQVKYRNRAFQQTHLGASPNAEKPSMATLERQARTFLKDHLGAELQLGRGESMELFKSAFEMQGHGGAVGGPQSESLVASIVVFTRVVDGLDVIGPGAKISVSFTSDGEVFGFQYDWASYEHTNIRQQVLDLPRIEERARLLDTSPVDAIVRVKRWECGYFDAGARKRDAVALVQPACAVHKEIDTIGDAARHRADPSDGLLSSATLDIIPAGVTPEADSQWPELRVLRGEIARPQRVVMPTTIEPASSPAARAGR